MVTVDILKNSGTTMNTNVWFGELQVLGYLAQHGGTDEADPFGHWSFHPSIVLGVIILTGSYLYAIGPLRRRYNLASDVDPTKVISFLVGVAILFLSLVSPLDVLADEYLFSAHMVQHILLSLFVPLFLIIGTPGWLIRPLIKPRIVFHVAKVLTTPVFALLIFNVNFWVWHLPSLYDLAVSNEQIHIFQHLTFISTGIINLWPILSPVEELPRLSYPRQLLYIAFNCQPNVVLGAILFFSRGLLYQAYANSPRLFGISPFEDQQIGGLIMWIPGNLIYGIIFSIIFLRWIQQEETNQRKMPT